MNFLTLSTVLFLIFFFVERENYGAEGNLQEKANQLHISLTGTSPSRAEIKLMINAFEKGQIEDIAYNIVDSRNGFSNEGAFYNVTVRNFATPWSSKEGSLFSKLNDMTLTVIGYARDEKPFNEILWRDTLYKAIGVTLKGSQLRYFSKNNYPSGTSASQICPSVHNSDPSGEKMRVWFVNPNAPNSSPTDRENTGCQLSHYTKKEFDKAYEGNFLYIPSLDELLSTSRIKESNNHYEEIEEKGLDLSNREVFQNTTQLVKLHRYPSAISGLFSTRAFGKAYYTAGTNRAAFAYSMQNFLCKSMEELNDTTIPDYRNRRDIDRSPGGTSSIYKNRCIGCHAGMDGMGGAFAYYDFRNGAILYEEGKVVEKMNHNVVFPDGYVTTDDSWINLWTEGQNSILGWGGPSSGNGVKEFGKMMASTQAFADCMGEQVFKQVCYRSPENDKEKELLKKNIKDFQKNNYNLKRLFIKTAIGCLE